MSAAAGRIKRLRRLDRIAVAVITLGGLSVIVGVLGILLFILGETVPLFRPARLEAAASLPMPAAAASSPGVRGFGVDEYRRYLSAVDPDSRIVFSDLASGQAVRAHPVPGLEPGTRITAASHSLLHHDVAAATADGRVALARIAYTPRYEGARLMDLEPVVRARGLVALDPSGRAVREVSYVDDAGRQFVAGLVDGGDIVVWRSDEDGASRQAVVRVAEGQRATHVRVGRNGAFVAATDTGRLYHWLFDADTPTLTDVSPVADEPVTAIEFLLGGSSVVVGTAGGGVSVWFRAAMPDGTEAMVRAQDFESQGSAVTAIAPSPRERTFAASGADGSIVLRHQTSGRTLARLAHGGLADVMLIAPKADALYLVRPGVVTPFTLDNPHPEVSWRALFGRVWYEGYATPEYVWQSTGATDDFEPKLSLVPLIFGTVKGTLYAMLFAVPLAVFGALYTSQFVHPSIRARIKPTVEIMAAVPSVVIGFLAGLYLASAVERHLVAVFVMIVLLPAFGTGGILVWRLLPLWLTRRLRPGSELLLIVPLVVLAGWVAVQTAPAIEHGVFAGDARSWLHTALGLTYDQRNCLVVGLAMGFAVIPIIFTIAEDAFTSVPSSLSAASLALGASRWQTAVRVVLPTASPGVFSAVMIGFGRAVGETMIVLMATGNTPIMEWSIFNGIRTLSANIAVEIPEAPHGGTLYRTLFLAAAVLFTMTFAINTLAEIVRQRLRERYKAV